jgi:hypothetical protein
MMMKTPVKEMKASRRLKINTLVEGFSFKNNKGKKVTPKKAVLL